MKRSETIRHWIILSVFVACGFVLIYRAYDLQILRHDFLRTHGDARSIRVVDIPAHRGTITDRNDELLAISTPVASIWTTPRQLLQDNQGIERLAKQLKLNEQVLQQRLKQRIDREFFYLKRHVSPDLAQSVLDMKIPGVHLQREYKRYYPTGEVAAHLLGFTNVDDRGQEGVELAYDQWLTGASGAKRVLKDRLGRIVENIESIRDSRPGKDLALSIDRRIQYLAYRELKKSVAQNKARSGTLVILDADTGEVLAMAVQPSFNPNNRVNLESSNLRNRAITDVFEPGSTIKPFTIAAALESGLFTPSTRIDTRPGYMRVANHTVRDVRNYGSINVAEVIRKSSNVGASKIALQLGAEPLWRMFTGVGFGQQTGSGFPGESAGLVNSPRTWSDVEVATAAFGYGLSVTALQLAQAYAVIASDGIYRPVTLQKLEHPASGRRVLSSTVSNQIRAMLASVVEQGGTGHRAAVEGYRVAGKTGTVHKSTLGGYAEHRYISLFAGMAPVSRPRLVAVVIIDEPGEGKHFGGEVAAPVFASVMRYALRILNVPPDALLENHGTPLIAKQLVSGGNT